MSKTNVSNGDTPAEVDAIDNNNEWKVSISIIRTIYLKIIVK